MNNRKKKKLINSSELKNKIILLGLAEYDTVQVL